MQIPRGDLFGLIGPNGAGKRRPPPSTSSPASTRNPAQSIYDGVRTDTLKPHEIAKAGLSRTFQNIRLMGELSVLDNVRLASTSAAILHQRHPPHAALIAQVAMERAPMDLLAIMGAGPPPR